MSKELNSDRFRSGLGLNTLLAALLVGALALRLWSAYANPNTLHPDEVFQYQEQAHRLVNGYGVVTWEYRDGLRSWSYPGALAGLLWVGEAVGGSPAAGWAMIWFVLGLSSLIPVWVAFRYGQRFGGWAGALCAGGLMAVWFEPVYFSTKTLTGVTAAHLLIGAIYLVYPARASGPGLSENAEETDWSHRRLALVGMLFGAVVVLRLHLTPAVGVAALWIAGFSLRRWGWLASGGGAVLLLGGLLDWLTWSVPFYSFWVNVYRNVVEGKAATFGVEPFHWYFYKIAVVWSWMLLPGGVLLLLGARRVPLLVVVAFVVVLSHSFIGHKEYRFIFPAMLLGTVCIAVGLAECVRLAERMRGFAPTLWANALTKPAGCVLCLGLIAWTSWSRSGDWPYAHWWVRTGAVIEAFDSLREREPQSVALVGLSWVRTPGYARLRRDVPMLMVADEESLREQSSRFTHAVSNYALHDPEGWLELLDYREVSFGANRQIYVYRLNTPFLGASGMTLNEQLIALGR